MKLRRCAIVFFEPRESVDFDLMSLFSGGAGLSRQIHWLALAPHLDDEVEVKQEEREILGNISPSGWINKKSFASQAIYLIGALLKEGLLVGDTKTHNNELYSKCRTRRSLRRRTAIPAASPNNLALFALKN
ncbi:hypothetical protein [Xanthomonas sacchari]|uniref:hypothetical protein n=1 Tax=Xanthomonas sacchari TaxID=56458 RepID=UPI0024349403|nr:hypothetical protein [Xanthomonas sacchari]